MGRLSRVKLIVPTVPNWSCIKKLYLELFSDLLLIDVSAFRLSLV